jgi:hypothetical protein
VSDGRDERARRRWLDTLRRETPGADRRAVLAWLAAAVADRHAISFGRDAPPLLRDVDARPPRTPPPPQVLDPGILGAAHEALLAGPERRRRGAFYTPDAVAAGLVRASGLVRGDTGRTLRVCDPAAGGGAFLLAAARELVGPGADPGTVVGEQLWGIDVDPLAVDVTIAALALFAARHGAVRAQPRVTVADALLTGLRAWSPPAAPFDLVVGNPPFLGQLRRRTARPADRTAALQAVLGDAVGPYTDTAALFLLAAVAMTAPGGRVVFVLPESVLGARDAAGVRAAVSERAAVVGLWCGDRAGFDAQVRVCAPVLDVGGRPRRSVRRYAGPAVEPVAPARVDPGALGAGASWAPLLAERHGVPPVALPPGPVLATLATATAGFRRQYYGIRSFVSERPDPDVGVPATGGGGEAMPLVTAGAIDPARLLWGRLPTRFAGRSWTAPVVDLAGLRAADPDLARWAGERRRPKVLVATQTAVVESVVDRHGRCYPSVPVVSVEPAPGRLWDVAAVVGAPAVSAWLAARLAGTALSAGSVRIGASHLLELPLPVDRDAWRVGAERLAAATAAAEAGDGQAWDRGLRAYAEAMGAAYGVEDPDLLAWWHARRPSWR